MDDSLFTNPTLVAYLVKRIRDKYPSQQIGKTVVQKLIFLLSHKIPIDFDYEMYHYGPYSNTLDREIRFAEDSHLIDVAWDEDRGYFMEATSQLDDFIHLMDKNSRKIIDETIDKYGHFRAKELAVITTALYLKDKYDFQDNEELISAVHSIKDHYDLYQIEDKLKRSGIIEY